MDEQKTKKPFYKRWWVWVIAVVIVFSYIISITDKNSTNKNPEIAKIQNLLSEAKWYIDSDTSKSNYWSYFTDNTLIIGGAYDKQKYEYDIILPDTIQWKDLKGKILSKYQIKKLDSKTLITIDLENNKLETVFNH